MQRVTGGGRRLNERGAVVWLVLAASTKRKYRHPGNKHRPQSHFSGVPRSLLINMHQEQWLRGRMRGNAVHVAVSSIVQLIPKRK